MIERIITLALLITAVVVSRAPRIRTLSPERRLYLLSAAGLLGLAVFRLLHQTIETAVATGAELPLPALILTALATAVSLLALALVWNAILADTPRRATRLVVIGLGALGALFGLLSLGLWTFLALPLALRTGWARPLNRRWTTVTAALVGMFALILWPQLGVNSFCWPPACHGGVALARLARVFLAVQLALTSVRLVFGVMFGPRRIGRRLLVSHLVIGVLPVVLTGFFVIVTALLAIAGLRASVASRLLREHHAVSQELLASHAARILDELAPGAAAASMAAGDAPAFEDLARRVAGRWSRVASWRPLPAEPMDRTLEHPEPSPRLFLALSTYEALPNVDPAAASVRVSSMAPSALDAWHSALVTEVSDAPPAANASRPLAGWILTTRTSGGDRRSGDCTGLAMLPPPVAWAQRPLSPAGLGLIKHGGRTFHATDGLMAVHDRILRIQVIEELSGGHERVTCDLLRAAARIEESLRFTQAGTPGSRDRHFTFSTDSLAAARPEESRVSSYGSSYELAPAQEWSSTGWQAIHLSVLGLAAIRDLVPSMPRLQENPLALLPVIVLLSTALLFVAVETAALVSAVRTGRAIGTAVSLLRAGTVRLRSGDLAHRIPVQGRDELAELGEAFNDMAHGLEEGRRHALERERLEGELALARQIQQRLLPQSAPHLPGYALAGLSVPARHVGGDYYDFICLPQNRLLFIMADVSGKGAPAALLMSSVRAALHSMPTGRERPAEIAARLNAFVLASTSLSEFVTLFLGLLDCRTGDLLYVNAGHEPPYLIHPDGSVERLALGGLLLGAFAHATYEDAAARLAPGDTLFLYTDGLSEAINPTGEMFGEDNIGQVLQAAPGEEPRAFLDRVLETVQGFAGSAEPSDDITLVAVRRVPSAASASFSASAPAPE
jgi:serine phosphatase RsbU (regulator of sigma subunit)